MLVHHDARNYDEAAKAAGEHARAKLEEMIEHGRARAGAVLQQVIDQVPTDEVVRAEAIRFAPAEGLRMVARFGNGERHERPVHVHALQQVAGRLGMPWGYLETLLNSAAQAPDGGWGADLAAHNLNELLTKAVPDTTRYLLRSVGGEIRGWLSDRYRRLDSRPIFQAAIEALQKVGAVPCEGHALATKVCLKAMLPRIYEPVPNEVMAYGVAIENSDFGDGALSARTFCLRLWCTNLAIMDQNLREVHLGARLAEDVAWSDKTYRLDTERMASMIGDVVQRQLGPAKIDELQAAVRKANEEKIDPKQAVAALRKNLTKGETDAAVEKFNSPDVELLPPGNTAWRLSNAVSWLAGQTPDEGRRIELEKVAGVIATR